MSEAETDAHVLSSIPMWLKCLYEGILLQIEYIYFH